MLNILKAANNCCSGQILLSDNGSARRNAQCTHKNNRNLINSTIYNNLNLIIYRPKWNMEKWSRAKCTCEWNDKIWNSEWMRFFGWCIAVSGFPYQRVLRKKLNFIYFSDGIFSLNFLFASLVLSFSSSTIENHYYVCVLKKKEFSCVCVHHCYCALCAVNKIAAGFSIVYSFFF